MEDLLNQTNTSITYTLKSDAIHLVIPAFVVNFIGAHLNTLIKCINLYFVDQYLFILVVLYTCTYNISRRSELTFIDGYIGIGNIFYSKRKGGRNYFI